MIIIDFTADFAAGGGRSYQKAGAENTLTTAPAPFKTTLSRK